MGRRSLLDAMWAMTVLTCVVLVAVTAGSLIVALGADATSSAGLDAWRGVVVAAPGLLVASTALAVLTVLRLRRGAAADAAALEVDPSVASIVHVVAGPAVVQPAAAVVPPPGDSR